MHQVWVVNWLPVELFGSFMFDEKQLLTNWIKWVVLCAVIPYLLLGSSSIIGKTNMKVANIAADTIALREAAFIPLEFFQSYPVPVIFNNQVALDFFFFPARGLPPALPKLYTPMIRITIAIDNGRILRKGSVVPKDYGLEIAPGTVLGEHDLSDMSLNTLDDFQVELFTSLDTLLEIFPDLPDKPEEIYVEAAVRYNNSFYRIAHKPLLPFYKNTNPLFFKWVESQATWSGLD